VWTEAMMYNVRRIRSCSKYWNNYTLYIYGL